MSTVTKNIILVTSNGIIRFIKYFISNPNMVKTNYKVKTGHICLFVKNEDADKWYCKLWNINPKEM